MTSNEIFTEFTRKFSRYPSQGLRGIGIECEIPVVFASGEAIPISLMQEMYPFLAAHGFDLQYDNLTGLIGSATRPNQISEREFGFALDTITVDTGLSTLEIALAPQRDLFTIQSQLRELIALLVHWFDKKNCKLLGYGIQPLALPSRKLLTPKERYFFFEKFSANRVIAPDEGTDCDLLNVTASNQCHLETSRSEAITAVNLLNAFSGLSIALHANSPIWKGAIHPVYKASREIFWDYCFPDRKAQTGIPPQFRNLEDYFQYLIGFPPLLVERDGRYLQIQNEGSFEDYMTNEAPAIGKTLEDEQKAIRPDLSDIHQHNTFCWFNARLVPKHGTVESRMCCQQPPAETLTSTALALGILENQKEAEKLMNQFSWESWRQLRLEAAQKTFSAEVGGRSILPILTQLLKIAQEGLKKRDLGEEEFLVPLFERVRTRMSPADQAISTFEKDGIEGLLASVAFSSQDFPFVSDPIFHAVPTLI